MKAVARGGGGADHPDGEERAGGGGKTNERFLVGHVWGIVRRFPTVRSKHIFKLKPY